MFIITRNMCEKIMSVFSYDYMGAGLRNEVKNTLTVSVYTQCIFFVVYLFVQKRQMGTTLCIARFQEMIEL